MPKPIAVAQFSAKPMITNRITPAIAIVEYWRFKYARAFLDRQRDLAHALRAAGLLHDPARREHAVEDGHDRAADRDPQTVLFQHHRKPLVASARVRQPREYSGREGFG